MFSKHCYTDAPWGNKVDKLLYHVKGLEDKSRYHVKGLDTRVTEVKYESPISSVFEVITKGSHFVDATDAGRHQRRHRYQCLGYYIISPDIRPGLLIMFSNTFYTTRTTPPLTGGLYLIPTGHLVPSLVGTCMCSYCWDDFFPNLLRFSLPFHFEYPSVLSGFC